MRFPLAELSAQSAGGALTLELPAFQNDIALKIISSHDNAVGAKHLP